MSPEINVSYAMDVLVKAREEMLLGETLRSQLHGSYWADMRIMLAAATATVGDVLPSLKLTIATVKDLQNEAYLGRRSEEFSIEDSKSEAKKMTGTQLKHAEYEYDRFRQAYEGGLEMLNALSSKIKTLESESHNQQ